MTVGKRAVKKAPTGPVGHSAGGKTLLESLWAELDDAVDVLRVDNGQPDAWEAESIGGAVAGPKVGVASEWLDWGEKRGRAQGLAWAIAKITSPYAPNIEAIKKQSWERANARWAE
jgi:hypothetical protein